MIELTESHNTTSDVVMTLMRREPEGPLRFVTLKSRARDWSEDRWADDGGAPARPSLEDFAELNPRWVCWAFARGENPYALITARDAEDAVRVIDYEDKERRRLPSAIVFSFWIMARWTEWAAEKGFTKSEHGRMPHEVAQLAGHNDFDAWLRRKVGA